jgi:hypothetical protein
VLSGTLTGLLSWLLSWLVLGEDCLLERLAVFVRKRLE